MSQNRSSSLFKPALKALYRKYGKLDNVNEKVFLKYHLGVLDKKLSANSKNRVISNGSGAKKAVLAFEYLPWDSAIFKMQIGRLDYFLPTAKASISSRKKIVGQAIALAKKTKLKFLSAKVNLGDFCGAQLLEEAGFTLKDVAVSFLCRLKDLKIEKPAAGIRSFKLTDLKQVLKIAAKSFVFNRFFNDSRLNKDSVRMMYAQWVRSSCLKNYSDVLVYSKKGRIKGFILCKAEAKAFGQIDLIAVLPDVKNKGIGTKLVKAALHKFKKKGMRFAEIRTQHANVLAVNSFIKAGFKRYTRGITLPSGLVFHKWL